MGTSGDATHLRELLYRAEAERLLLQHKHDGLELNGQQLSADMHKLQQQLADAHSAFAEVQQQNQQLVASNGTLKLQVETATQEYRANDIICCHLRDQITKLQHQFNDSQQTCKQQGAEIATFADEMSALRHCKTELTQQLSSLQEQHQQLAADKAIAVRQLQDTRLELEDSKQRWLQEHGDIAAQMQALLDEKQQQEASMAHLNQQLADVQGALQQQQAKSSELASEVSSVRDLVMVLGKAIGKQPRGQELPGHEDPVWAVLGPLGGVQYALEVVMRHIRSQDSRVKELKAEMSQLEDRLRSESAQKTELQAGLFEVRGLYAKAIAHRESLESRAARAEAEKAAAENNWQRAKAQADEDSARLSELQASVLGLTKQVQQLLPLQPRCSTLEVERDAAQHKLDRLQEQHDQLQRQLQQAVGREAELRTGLETYKQEHGQLLSANAQLLEQCQGLNKRVQVLEISNREGSLAAGQLEEARKRLNTTQNQLEVMSDSHARTLSKLETAKMLLGGLSTSQEGSPAGGSGPASGASSPGGATHSSSLRTSMSRNPSSRPSRSHLSGSGAADDAPSLTAAEQQQGQQLSCSRTSPEPCDGQQSAAGASSNSSSRRKVSLGTGDSEQMRAAAAAAAVVGQPGDEDVDLADELSGLPPEVAAMLRAKGLDQQLRLKQRNWHEMKVSMLSYFCNQLRQRLVQEVERSAHLEVDMLQQEMDLLHLMQQREQAISEHCLAAAAEARDALQQLLLQLRQAMYEDTAACTAEGGALPLSDPGPVDDACKRSSWLHVAVSNMITNLQAVAADAKARAALIAARRQVAVQSDDPVETNWLQFVRALPQSGVTHALHHKAVAEAIVRIYLRALHQQEAVWMHQQQNRSGQGLITAGAGGGGSSTLFDVMMAHYSQQQQHDHVQTYSANLWQDLEGPVARLLVSCRALTSSSTKVALFCCFAGTHPAAPCWGPAHWQHLMLLLRATKRLVAGSWKAVMRDWSSVGGARLPLQCVHDLLGNVYNCDLGQLTHLPALMNSRQLLLRQPAGAKQPAAADATGAPPGSAGAAASTAAGSPPGSASAAAAAATGSPPGSAAAAPRSSTSGGGVGPTTSTTSSSSSSSRRVVPERGSVAAALELLVTDCPSGLSVDLDGLLGCLMLQFDAGLLPLHPLLEPRRLTDGSLANTGNAWGTAAVKAAVFGGQGSAAGRQRLASPLFLAAGGSSIGAEISEDGRSDWNLLYSSASGVSGGSRPVTGVLSRAATASMPGGGGGSAELASPSGSSSGLLPRIRAPDASRPSSSFANSVQAENSSSARQQSAAGAKSLMNRASSRVAFT